MWPGWRRCRASPKVSGALHVTVRPDHDVFRLDVTMNNTGCVCSGERLGDLKPEIGNLRRGRACAQTLSQSDAVDEFHYNHRRRPIRYDFINGDNVGMVQGRSSAGLFEKSRRGQRVPIAPAARNFRATIRSRSGNRAAAQTSPIPPRPSERTTAYRPIRIPAVMPDKWNSPPPPGDRRVTGGRDQIEQNFRIEARTHSEAALKRLGRKRLGFSRMSQLSPLTGLRSCGGVPGGLGAAARVWRFSERRVTVRVVQPRRSAIASPGQALKDFHLHEGSQAGTDSIEAGVGRPPTPSAICPASAGCDAGLEAHLMYPAGKRARASNENPLHQKRGEVQK